MWRDRLPDLFPPAVVMFCLCCSPPCLVGTGAGLLSLRDRASGRAGDLDRSGSNPFRLSGGIRIRVRIIDPLPPGQLSPSLPCAGENRPRVIEAGTWPQSYRHGHAGCRRKAAIPPVATGERVPAQGQLSPSRIPVPRSALPGSAHPFTAHVHGRIALHVPGAFGHPHIERGGGDFPFAGPSYHCSSKTLRHTPSVMPVA